MSDQAKAMVVIVCLFLFCAVPVAGPMLGNAGDEVVKRALGVTPEVQMENRKRRSDSRYLDTTGGQAPLQAASQCCLKCGAKWRFNDDNCDAPTQEQELCYVTCASK